jgi:hypothetical protein
VLLRNHMIEEQTPRVLERREARLARRYPIAARVSFQWRGPDRLWCQGIGMTQDISASGASILAHNVPPLGAEIEVIVMLPLVKQGSTAEGRLCGIGSVVRITPGAGFAATVTFRILKAEEPGNSKAH